MMKLISKFVTALFKFLNLYGGLNDDGYFDAYLNWREYCSYSSISFKYVSPHLRGKLENNFIFHFMQYPKLFLRISISS